MRTTTLLATLAFTIAFAFAGSLAAPAQPIYDPTHVFTGPYAGVLGDGDSAVEHYQNVPSGTNCIQIVQPYRVEVVTTPPDIPVRVSVGSHAVISTGVALLSFESGVCTHFHIDVENLGEDAVAYAMHVTSGPLGGAAICNQCISIGP